MQKNKQLKLVPLLEANNEVMLTLTFNNRMQHIDLKVVNRLNRFREYYIGIIKPVLSKIFIQYEMSLELSEVLASEGSKFPRLHYHIKGVIKCPITYHLYMGEFLRKDLGYHTTIIETKEDSAYYTQYIRKQRDQWKSSPFVILHKDLHK